MSENKKVTKAAGVVGIFTFISRLFGFARDIVIANFFGAGLYSDAFFVAMRIPNLLRRLFAEGSLSIAFVPVFTEYLSNSGKDEAFKMARACFYCVSLCLLCITALGIMFSPLIIRIVAPGFIEEPGKFTLTVHLLQIMFPYIFFISLVALCMGLLNSLGHFAAPAFAPVLLNVSMIVAAYFASLHTNNIRLRVYALAFGVLIGGFFQLALQIPFIIKKGIFVWKKTKIFRPIFHKGVKKVGLLMIPTVFGAAVYQINILIGTFLASLLQEGSVSYLYYADRLVQFPLGIFAIAIATAILPSISKQASAKDYDSVKDTFAYALRLVFIITIPAMIGLIVLKEPIVAILFKRGQFNQDAVKLTSNALFYYAIGLWAFSAVRIVVSTFYALSDTKTPVKTATVSIIVNILLSIILMGPLGHCGLALATSIASMVNLILLIWFFKKKLGFFSWKKIGISVYKSAVASIFMGVVVLFVNNKISSLHYDNRSAIVLNLFLCILVGMIVYCVFLKLLKSSELKLIYQILKKGFLKK